MKQLSHHRLGATGANNPGGISSASSEEEIAWARSRSELRSASSSREELPAFERALTTIAGEGSALRTWGQLVEESATRLARIERQGASLPPKAAALDTEVGRPQRLKVQRAT